MAEHRAEDLLTNLGVTLQLDPDQQLQDVIVLARVTDFRQGGTALAVGISPGVDWILQKGLLAAALDETRYDPGAA